MAGVADKARFFLEKSVPQLREWERKDIFNQDEIRNIVSKRNDFEHRVLSPGNVPADWSAYAKWEHSLETLRVKRCQRLKIRHLASGHAGQGRVLSIYDRGTKRHANSAWLWKEYLQYTAKVKASKRFRRVMTEALRMMPNEVELWTMAGRRSAHNGDMASARSFFMRGCRFCTRDATLWLEYTRCEMDWLAKVERRKADKPQNDPLKPDQSNGADDELRIEDSDEESDVDEEGRLLPQPSKEQAKVIDKPAAKQLQNNPAMDGAIPMAIFDISKKQSFFGPETAARFFLIVASYRNVSAQPKVSQHILSHMDEHFATHPATADCHVRQPILGLRANTAEFVQNLREVLARLDKYLAIVDDKAGLASKTVAWIDDLLADAELDEALRKVLEHTKQKMQAV
ncbi:U3 small nucleolar RNA-associated protein 6-domain-containing protein [Emericellopsis atlantica]|uniref:U3 small nucleolar RNA-associated protein 6-domain-containing protein n=1 Tax=Emericellopsis atlantica TaxID=2614577 RepID=A0A9P7ZF69_9HYPO|nr:U3 small nucleolar RNA-associated protein 6-domain-containing protein [Emericellopsis atlantica]KAG9251029.1 U3 small nucleolar RNA-associated protein 6-domain-containing protein [Emericellopsis atlantica]